METETMTERQTDQTERQETETVKTEIKDLTYILSRPAKTETLTDPKTISLVKYIDRLTMRLTPSYGLSLSLRDLRVSLSLTRKTLRKIGDFLSESMTLSDLEIGDRVRLSQTGMVWSVFVKTPGLYDRERVLQMRSENGSFRTYQIDRKEIGDRQVWPETAVSENDFRQIVSLTDSLSHLIVSLTHKVKTHDLKTGDQIKDLRDPKSGEIDRQYMTWIVSDNDSKIVSFYNSLSEYRTQSLESLSDDLYTGDQVLTGYMIDPGDPETGDPETDPDKDGQTDSETRQNDPSDPDQTDPETETPDQDPETGQKEIVRLSDIYSDLEIGDRVRLSVKGLIWSVLYLGQGSGINGDYVCFESPKKSQRYYFLKDNGDRQVWPVKTPKTGQSDPESIRQTEETVSSISEDPETPETPETPKDASQTVSDFDPETPDPESETLTLKIGDSVSSKFNLTIWRVSQIDPESETVSLVNTLDQTETLTQSFRSLLYSFHITLLIVHRDGRLYQKDLYETPVKTLTLGQYQSEDPEIVSPETERPKTWRDRETGDLRDRLFDMISETDGLMTFYHDFLTLARDAKKTISLLTRLQKDPETLTRSDWKEIGDRQSDPSYYVRKSQRSLDLYVLDLEDMTEDIESLTDGLSSLHTEIGLRVLDSSDYETEDLEIFSLSWQYAIKETIKTLDLFDPSETEDHNIETAVSVSETLKTLRVILGDPGDSVRLSETLNSLETLSGLWSQDINDQWKDPEIVSLTGQVLRILINTMESLTLETVRPSLLSSVFVGHFADQVWSLLDHMRRQTEDLTETLTLRDLDSLDHYETLRDRLFSFWSDLQIVSETRDFETPSQSLTLGLTRSILRLTKSLEDSDDHFLIWEKTETETLTQYLKTLTRDLESGDCHYMTDQTIDRVRSLIVRLKDWKTRRQTLKTLTETFSDLSSDYETPETLKSEEIKDLRDRLCLVSEYLSDLEDPEDPEDLEIVSKISDSLTDLFLTLDSLGLYDGQTDSETRQNDPETGQTEDQTPRPETESQDPKTGQSDRSLFDLYHDSEDLINDLTRLSNMSLVSLLTSESQYMTGLLISQIWSVKESEDRRLKTLTLEESDLFWTRTLAILRDLEDQTEDLTISLRDPVSKDDLRVIIDNDPDLITKDDLSRLSETQNSIEIMTDFLIGLYDSETLIFDPDQDPDSETPETLSDGVFDPSLYKDPISGLFTWKTPETPETPETPVKTLTRETVSQDLEDLIKDLEISYRDPSDPVNRLETISDRLSGLLLDLDSLLLTLSKDPETPDFETLCQKVSGLASMINIIIDSGHDMTLINTERLHKRLASLIKVLRVKDPETLKSETLISISVFGVREDQIRQSQIVIQKRLESLISTLTETRSRLFDPSLYDHYTKKTRESESISRRLEDLKSLTEDLERLSNKINDLTIETADLPFSIYQTLGLSQYDIEDPETGSLLYIQKDPETDSQNDPETGQSDPSKTDQV